MKRSAMFVVLFALAAVAVLASLLPVLPVDAANTAGFATGGGTKDQFSFAGRVYLTGNGTPKGHFVILEHFNVPDGTSAAATCTYRTFDQVTISGNHASFHSVGKCKVLLTDGSTSVFTSDNVFSITDNGEPGAGTDIIDVNFLGPGGISIPGGVLSSGNFIITAPGPAGTPRR
jgi:hypothetical protein